MDIRMYLTSVVVCLFVVSAVFHWTTGLSGCLDHSRRMSHGTMT